MKSRFLFLATVVAACLVVAACSAPAAPAPTAAPAKPAAEPTKAAPAAQPTAAQPTAAPAAPKASWPEKGKTLTIIVPWPPGNTADLMSRLLAPMLEKELGVVVEVVNKDGAGSQVGLTEMTKAKPDGYTILANSLPTTPLIYLDPQRGAAFNRNTFTPIAVANVDPSGFNARTDGPYKTIKDLVEAGKANPGKIKLGTNGYMNATHLLAVQLQKATGAKFALAHFDGSTKNVAALMGGHIDISVCGPGAVTQFIKSNEVQVLGLSDMERSRLLPDVKTLKEQGYDLVYVISRGFVGPAGMPKDVVDTLAGVIKKATEDANFKSKMQAQNAEVRYIGPAEYAKLWDDMDASTKGMMAEAQATK